MSLFETLFVFRGRINREGWWLAHLLIFGVGIIVYGIATLLKGTDNIVYSFCIVCLYWMHVAVSVKRWHDLDKSGWWVLVELILVFGLFYEFVVLGLCKGTRGRNHFGPDPLKYKVVRNRGRGRWHR